MDKKTYIVTRYQSFAQYLKEYGLAPSDAIVVEKLHPKDAKGAHVIGRVPLWVACEAETVTNVPMLNSKSRNKPMSIDEIAKVAGEPTVYRVRVDTTSEYAQAMSEDQWGEEEDDEPVNCHDCKGTGIGYPVDRACRVCGGSGVER